MKIPQTAIYFGVNGLSQELVIYEWDILERMSNISINCLTCSNSLQTGKYTKIVTQNAKSELI